MVEAVNPVRGREQCSSGGHCLHFLIARHSYKIFAYHWWINIYVKRVTNTRNNFLFFNTILMIVFIVTHCDFSFHFFFLFFFSGIIDSYFEVILCSLILNLSNFFFFFNIFNIIVRFGSIKFALNFIPNIFFCNFKFSTRSDILILYISTKYYRLCVHFFTLRSFTSANSARHAKNSST